MAAPSAKGLFRATGKVSSDTTAREEHDFYPTPSEVTRAFLSAEGARLKELGRVWEPACGDGAMSKELTGFGLECVCTDLIDRGCPGAEIGSFYDYSETLAPAIVTNPPYCEINARDGQGRWLQHSLGLGVEYAAFFLNADWPHAAGLSGLLSRHPISRIYGCRWKVDFTGKGAPPQRNAWFVWDRTWRSKDTAFRLLDRTDVRQSAWGF